MVERDPQGMGLEGGCYYDLFESKVLDYYEVLTERSEFGGSCTFAPKGFLHT